MSSFTPPSLSVIIAVLAALLAGFLLGRMGRDKGDPGDFSRQRPAPPEPASSLDHVETFKLTPSNLPPDVVAHIEARRLIDAIKALRQAYPEMSLKGAKNAVDAYVRNNGLR